MPLGYKLIHSMIGFGKVIQKTEGTLAAHITNRLQQKAKT